MHQNSAWYFKCLLLFVLSISDLLQILVLVDQFTKIAWFLKAWVTLQIFLCLNVIIFRYCDMSKSVITFLTNNRYDDILVFVTSIVLLVAIQHQHYEKTPYVFAASFVASMVLNISSIYIYYCLLSEYYSPHLPTAKSQV